MPRPPRPTYDKPTIKARIVARVRAGATVAGACRADPSLPCAESITLWARADPLFAAELARARRVGDFARRLAFDEAVAAAFLARLRAGATVRELLGRPGMPGAGTYRFWRRTQMGFQGDLWQVKQTRAEARRNLRMAGLRGGGGRPFRAFDRAMADRILARVARGEPLRRMLETDPALPCRAVVYRWRAAEPEWAAALTSAIRIGRRMRARARSRCTPELTEEVVARIVEGGSLRSLARDPDMPCAGTLYAWAARRPEFARAVARACEHREDWYVDQMLLAVEAAGPESARARRARVAPWSRQLARLKKRPGWKRTRARRPGRA